MNERTKVNIKVSSEVNTILHELFNQIQYEFCEQYEEEIERLNNIISQTRDMLYKRDLDSYDIYTANVVLDIQSDFEEILRGE